MYLPCSREDCDTTFYAKRSDQMYCSRTCSNRVGKRRRRAQGRVEVPPVPQVVSEVDVLPLTLDERYLFHSGRAEGCWDLPSRIIHELSRLSQAKVSVRVIGKRVGVGPETVLAWQKEHPFSCEQIPEVEVYDNLFQHHCRTCELETFMWVLSETVNRLVLYCPDCHQNDELLHPRIQHAA